MAGTTFRDRERLVLLSGAAAAAFFALVLLARIVGMSFGSFGGKVDLQASIMDVKGQASADSLRFDMKGYCIFGGTMKRE